MTLSKNSFTEAGQLTLSKNSITEDNLSLSKKLSKKGWTILHYQKTILLRTIGHYQTKNLTAAGQFDTIKIYTTHGLSVPEIAFRIRV